MGDIAVTRALVWGLAVAGTSTVRALQRRDVEVLVADDVVTDAKRSLATELDVELIDGANSHQIDVLVDAVDLVCPAPGVPETHRLIERAMATGADLVTELELAYRWEQERLGGPRPMLAVTGTDGKTTTTHLIEHLANACGWPTALFGTLANRWPGHSITATHTTAFADRLQAQLAEAVDQIQAGHAGADHKHIECLHFIVHIIYPGRFQANVRPSLRGNMERLTRSSV